MQLRASSPIAIHRVRRAVVCAAAVAVVAVPAIAKRAPQAPAAPAKVAATPVREIEAARGFERHGDLQLQFGQDTGLLRHVYRRSPAGAVAARAVAPRAVAEAFLAEHAALLGLDAVQVQLATEKATPSGTHFRYDQHVDGVPVYRAEVVVKVALDGQLSSLHSTLRPAVAKVATRPSLDRNAALAIGRDAVGPTGRPLADYTATLQVVELESGPSLAWLVSIPVDQPLGDWLVFVDAQTGQLLRVEDRLLNVDGSGRVFDPDPRTATNNPALVDGNDADAAVPFPASYADRALLSITQNGSTYSLSGPYAQILDFEAPAGAPITTMDPNAFFFQRSAQGFEDVMCYFHLDQNQRYIQSLGFNNVNNRVQIVDPHGLSGADNSHYVIASQRLAFGEGGVDDAEDADVVLHEYGHSIQHNIVPGWGGGQEGAMGEGFGDYWAGSYSIAVNPTFQPRFVFTWDGHNAFWPGRVLVDSTLHYPENCCGQVHASGTLWCSGTTDALRRLGRAVMDRLMLDHHFGLGTSATMADAANQVIQSDLDLYAGAHLATLVQVFDFWGFVDSEDFVPTVAHTPLADTNDTTGPYTVTANIQSVQPLDPGALDVFWGIGAFTDSVALVSVGGNNYEADIPGPLTGVVVRYYIRARDVNGGTTVQPPGAPGSYYSFHVGPNNGILSGRVRLHGQSDHSGATVTLEPGGATTQTDMLGDYALPNLFADAYQVTVAKTGYATAVRPGVVVSVGTASEHNDFVLFSELQTQACVNPNQAITEGVFGVSNNQSIVDAWPVQGVEVDVNILHPNIGELVVELRHGTRTVRLHNQTGGTADNIVGTYPTTLAVSGPGTLADFIGDPSNGIWTLRMVDANSNASGGVLVSWCLRLRGPSNIATDTGPGADAQVAALWASEPNPAPGGQTAIRFAVPRAGAASLVVFDVAGRRVRTLLDGPVTAGLHESRWDGRRADGAPVPAGVYFYRLVTADADLTRKVVVSR